MGGSRLWSLYWADTVHGWNYHTAQIGAFKEGRGEFYGCEPFEGKSIFSRSVWSSSSATSCRWEQAFSEDADSTWETNWMMEFARIKQWGRGSRWGSTDAPGERPISPPFSTLASAPGWTSLSPMTPVLSTRREVSG